MRIILLLMMLVMIKPPNVDALIQIAQKMNSCEEKYIILKDCDIVINYNSIIL